MVKYQNKLTIKKPVCHTHSNFLEPAVFFLGSGHFAIDAIWPRAENETLYNSFGVLLTKSVYLAKDALCAIARPPVEMMFRATRPVAEADMMNI
jgi:hypothetical protein